MPNRSVLTRNRGYAAGLIQLLVAMAIIGVLLMMMRPSSPELDKAVLDQSLKSLCSEFRRGAGAASNDGQRRMFLIKTDSKDHRIEFYRKNEGSLVYNDIDNWELESTYSFEKDGKSQRKVEFKDDFTNLPYDPGLGGHYFQVASDGTFRKADDKNIRIKSLTLTVGEYSNELGIYGSGHTSCDDKPPSYPFEGYDGFDEQEILKPWDLGGERPPGPPDTEPASCIPLKEKTVATINDLPYRCMSKTSCYAQWWDWCKNRPPGTPCLIPGIGDPYIATDPENTLPCSTVITKYTPCGYCLSQKARDQLPENEDGPGCPSPLPISLCTNFFGGTCASGSNIQGCPEDYCSCTRPPGRCQDENACSKYGVCSGSSTEDACTDPGECFCRNLDPTYYTDMDIDPDDIPQDPNDPEDTTQDPTQDPTDESENTPPNPDPDKIDPDTGLVDIGGACSDSSVCSSGCCYANTCQSQPVCENRDKPKDTPKDEYLRDGERCTTNGECQSVCCKSNVCQPAAQCFSRDVDAMFCECNECDNDKDCPEGGPELNKDDEPNCILNRGRCGCNLIDYECHHGFNRLCKNWKDGSMCRATNNPNNPDNASIICNPGEGGNPSQPGPNSQNCNEFRGGHAFRCEPVPTFVPGCDCDPVADCGLPGPGPVPGPDGGPPVDPI